MKKSSLRQRLKQEESKMSKEHDMYSFYTYPGAALYMLDMVKDALDTFKPYKNTMQRERDLWQWYYGLRNTIVGAMILPLAVFIVITSPFMMLYTPPIFGLLLYLEKGGSFTDHVRDVFSHYNQFFLGGIKNIAGSLMQCLRGITQLLTSPLALMRIVWRDYLTEGQTPEHFQDRKSIKKLVADADKLIKNNPTQDTVPQMIKILDELYRKSCQQAKRQQSTYPIDKKLENERVEKLAREWHEARTREEFIHRDSPVLPRFSVFSQTPTVLPPGGNDFSRTTNAEHFFHTHQTGKMEAHEIEQITKHLEQYRVPNQS